MSEILLAPKTGRILVMDDDPQCRSMLERLLRSAGYTVSLAANGVEGVEKYRARPADVLLTDIFLPTREGLESIMELRRLDPDLPIIALSGRPIGDTMLCVAHHLGAAATLEKDSLDLDLLDEIDKALSTRGLINSHG